MTEPTPRTRKLDLDTISRLSMVRPGDSAEGLAEVQRYLRSYGYLRRADYTPDQLDQPTSDALYKYQERHGLSSSGAFDNPTREEMTQSRCAMPDMRNGVAFATACAWDRRTLTFAFDSGTDDVPGAAEIDAVRAAFATWAAAAPLTFTEVSVGQNPDIRIGWRPATDPDLSMVGGTLAHADFPPGCSVVTNTLPKPVHFDDSEHTWSVGAQPGAFDVETVALHEIGHILGLAHSSVPGAVMFPTVRPDFTLRALTADDLAAIDALYALPWRDIGHANNVVAMAGLNGKLYCATSDNQLWMRDPVGWEVDWVAIGHANNVVAMAGLNGKLFCATSDNRLWIRDPFPWEVDWTDIGHAATVVAMAALNGKLFCATADSNLWMRDPSPWEVNWTDIGHANNAVGMAGLSGKLFCATADGNLWMRDPSPWEVDWTDVGHANNVVAMDAVNGSLFCATSDSRLWMRPPGI
ncbi:matrixin family metalloprotease [Dactylosporangium sp. NBC_01737]|uniref:matrixin family metalloprotease n=1 Tax=Dactylosporangium sp. NBC_01737 TaxID=2975959 RepID=UPI002E15F334|nr:matrixin family metalloprotease [Dactylosporangium sp. NBC_01737]